MAIIFGKNIVYKHPVTFVAPDPSGSGRSVSETYIFEWELADSDLIQNPDNLSDSELTTRAIDELKAKLRGWNIPDPDNPQNDLPFTDENIEMVMSKMWATNQLLEEWLKCSSGGERKKKSRGVR